MNKKTLLLSFLALGLIVIVVKILLFPPKVTLSTPATQQETKVNIKTSKTLKTYTDPSSFSFSYPDNLSLLNNELIDSNTYADLQLSAKEVNGTLHLKISDSKFKSIDEWVTSTGVKVSPKEVKLGNIKAQEMETDDKLILGALDSGVLFNIDVPLGDNKEFWMSVYKSVLEDFTFTSPTDTTALQGDGRSSDVTFEGEEAVEQ